MFSPFFFQLLKEISPSFSRTKSLRGNKPDNGGQGTVVKGDKWAVRSGLMVLFVVVVMVVMTGGETGGGNSDLATYFYS